MARKHRPILLKLFGQRSSQSMLRRGKTHVLFEIDRPFPTQLLGRKPFSQGGKWWSWPFVRLFGREWYFPTLLTVWRKGDRVWVQFVPWQKLRRWLFTRCEGCGERLPYGYAPVSRMKHIHGGNTKSVQLGEVGCYHHECPPDPMADYSATDGWDRSWGHDDGLRRNILNEPIWVAIELAMLAAERRDAEMRYRKRLMETRRELGFDQFRWKLPPEAQQTEEAPSA